MAAIAGAVSIGSFRVTEEYVSWLAAPMTHRSQDIPVSYTSSDSKVGLTHLGKGDEHSRLGQHPSGIIAILAGRLERRPTLLKKLQASDPQLSNRASDAMLLAYAFARWGNDAFEHIEGGYAGAIWSPVTRSLTLVRSSNGVMPLFYSFIKGRLVFSTEAKGCLSDPEIRPKLNEEAFFHFLTFVAVPPPATLFKGVSKMEAGSWTRMTPDGDFRSGRFWPAASRIEKACELGNVELSQRVLRGTRQSFMECGAEGERLGVFLDGGLTASATAIALAKFSPAKVATYSVLVGPLTQPEVDAAKRVNEGMKALGIPHHVVQVGAPKFQGHLPQLASLQDEPNNRSGDVLLYFAAQAAGEHGVDRMVNPLGGNAVFQRLMRWADIAKKSRMHERKSITWLREASVGIAKLAKRPMGEKIEQMERSLEGLPFYWAYRELFTRDEKFELLSARLKHELATANSWNEIAPYWSRFEHTNPETPIEDWMPFLEISLGLPEGLLMRHDQMMYGAGVPQVCPFLNPILIQDALALHRVTKDAEDLPRTTFEKVFGHLLPNVPLDAGTGGAPVRSMSKWFFDTLGTSPTEATEEFFRQSDIFDRRAVRELMKSDNHDRKWHVFNFIQWWRGWFGV